MNSNLDQIRAELKNLSIEEIITVIELATAELRRRLVPNNAAMGETAHERSNQIAETPTKEKVEAE